MKRTSMQKSMISVILMIALMTMCAISSVVVTTKEIVDFSPTTTGTYTIVVKNIASSDTRQKIMKALMFQKKLML